MADVETKTDREVLPQDQGHSAQGPVADSGNRDFDGLVKSVWLIIKRVWGWLAYTIGSIVLAFVILGLILARTMSAGGTNNEQTISGAGPDKIVLIPLSGVIGGGSSVLSATSGITYDQVDRALRQASDDSRVKAVILEVDSPGGSAVVSDQIYDRIKDFEAKTHKKVVASFGDVVASGGYYISTAANKIVANPATLTGSIGVIMEYYNAGGLLDKVGVQPEVIKSGQYKDIGSPTRDMTADERTILQGLVDQTYEQFVGRVAAGRGMSTDAVKKLADGRVFTGSQAKDNGLVDILGNRETAVNVAKDLAGVKGEDVLLVEYGQGGYLQQLFGDMSGKLSSLNPLTQLNVPQPRASLQYLWQP